jgi:hypothetical protein
MENTEEQKFVDAYKKWLEQKPTSDKVDYVDFQGLCILKSEQENALESKVLVNGQIHNVTSGNALLMYKQIESNVMQSSFRTINKLLEEKVLSNPKKTLI